MTTRAIRRFSRMDHYLHQPNEVSLETQAVCNAACTFCPYPTMARIGDKMPDDLIERLVCEMENWHMPFYFSPFKVNEPLLDKRVIPLCHDVIKRTKAIIRFFTNGSPLTEANIAALAELPEGRVAHLWVSLNEHRPDEYRALMHLDFDKVARNLDRLHESDFPHPVILSTVGYPNEEFRRYCFDRWPKFESMAIRRTGWLGEIDPQEHPIPEGECSRWWELSIMASGKVSLCCMDSEGKYELGDVNTDTMLDVYGKMLEHRVRRRRDFHPCSTCNY